MGTVSHGRSLSVGQVRRTARGRDASHLSATLTRSHNSGKPGHIHLPPSEVTGGRLNAKDPPGRDKSEKTGRRVQPAGPADHRPTPRVSWPRAVEGMNTHPGPEPTFRGFAHRRRHRRTTTPAFVGRPTSHRSPSTGPFDMCSGSPMRAAGVSPPLPPVEAVHAHRTDLAALRRRRPDPGHRSYASAPLRVPLTHSPTACALSDAPGIPLRRDAIFGAPWPRVGPLRSAAGDGRGETVGATRSPVSVVSTGSVPGTPPCAPD